MIDKSKIDEIVDKIVKGFNPEKIILFGSYAAGNPNNDSDLDLLIVQETDLPAHRRAIDMRLSLIGSKVPMDILVYTSSEFNEDKNKQNSFIYSAIQNSEILYERTT